MASRERNNDNGNAPVSRGRRFFKLAGMTASVAGSYAKSKVRSMVGANDEDAEAERWRQAGLMIAETLGELKGAVMKVGQVASQARDLLPPEIADALASLQNEAPPMDFDVIARQIEREFGMSYDRLFRTFETEPFAAASIGQVHRATMDDGRDVVVKVQYPGVDESCDSDLAHLRMAFRASGILKVNRQAMNDMFEELRARLHEELDYTNEAENVRLFREFHASDEGLVIPEVVGERSSQRILTMIHEPGDRVDHVDFATYDQETRNLIGRRLFRMMVRQVFDLQVVHGDPHPGNFAFRPDGTVVIYDFGCVKKLRPDIVSAYRDALRYGIAEDWDRVDDALIALGARIPEHPPLGAEFYKPWRDLFFEPFASEGPYAFAGNDINQRFVKMAPRVLRYLDALKPPVETMFIDRALGGHLHTMASLHVVEDFGPAVRAVIDGDPEALRALT